MDAEQRAVDATTRRLLTSLVREGLARARQDGGAIVVSLPGGEVRAEAPAVLDMRWLHPDELGPVHLDGEPVADPRALLDAAELDASKTRLRDLRRALRSSVVHGTEAFAAPWRRPRLEGPAVAWERALRTGSAHDPCHQTRTGWTNRQSRELAPECAAAVDVAFVAVRGAELGAAGEWPTSVDRWLPRGAGPGERVVPVHPAAVDAVRAAHPASRLLDGTRRCDTAAPLGRVLPEGLDVQLQLSVPAGARLTADGIDAAVELSAAARAIDPDGVGVVADRGGRATDTGDLGVVVQERAEAIWSGERFVSVAALTGRTPGGAPLILGLPGGDDPEALFSAWAGRLLDALVPLVERGLLPSTDPRHWRARYRAGRLVGVAVEGWWDARAHGPTLRRHVPGVDVGVAGTEDLEPLFARAWDAWIGDHLGHVLRLLGLGPRGMALVRQHVDRLLQPGTGLHDAWTGWTVPHRCAVRSRLEGRDVFRDLPNPLSP